MLRRYTVEAPFALAASNAAMKVYGNPRSTCTRKVLTVLHEKGAPHELVVIDLANKEQKSDEHLARQPFGVVPVLEHDGFSMYESRAIVRYLDRILPEPPLTPSDARDYARMEQFISVEASYFSPGALVMLMHTWGRPGYDEARASGARPTVERALDVAERALSERPYFAGDAFSLADVTWMPYVAALADTKFGSMVKDRAAFWAWWSRVSQRASWKKVAS